eukprot:3761087-Prymnesium_polylepis.1
MTRSRDVSRIHTVNECEIHANQPQISANRPQIDRKLGSCKLAAKQNSRESAPKTAAKPVANAIVRNGTGLGDQITLSD